MEGTITRMVRDQVVIYQANNQVNTRPAAPNPVIDLIITSVIGSTIRMP